MRHTTYAEGTPSWVDLSTPDTAATTAFYGGVFGWTPVEAGPETGGYIQYELDGVAVAGAGPLMAEGQPVFWSSYFAVTDADATAAKVASAGGHTFVAPMDVLDLGRMAIFADPSGAAFGVWQKGNFAGAGVTNEPGSLIWNELMTRDVPGSVEFYGQTLGLTGKASDASDVPYTELQVGDASVAGIMDINRPEFPADLPPHWMVYFATADCDATCAKVEEHGGTVSVPPTDIPIGRFAVVADQHGAFFSVIKMAG